MWGDKQMVQTKREEYSSYKVKDVKALISIMGLSLGVTLRRCLFTSLL